MTAEQPAAPLPGREPHSLLVHFVVDTTIAFLLVVIVMLIVGASIWLIVGLAVVLGAVAAPFTRRAEVSALEERRSALPPEG